jgi:hypothetical protein
MKPKTQLLFCCNPFIQACSPSSGIQVEDGYRMVQKIQYPIMLLYILENVKLGIVGAFSFHVQSSWHDPKAIDAEDRLERSAFVIDI